MSCQDAGTYQLLLIVTRLVAKNPPSRYTAKKSRFHNNFRDSRREGIPTSQDDLPTLPSGVGGGAFCFVRLLALAKLLARASPLTRARFLPRAWLLATLIPCRTLIRGVAPKRAKRRNFSFSMCMLSCQG